MTAALKMCGACGEPFGLEDRPSAEYPFCRSCHYSGAAMRTQYAMTIAQIEAFGLRVNFWHTGGGCWVMVLQRHDAPDQWGHIEESGVEWVEGGPWEPYVGCTDAYEESPGSWVGDAGLPNVGEPWSAMYFPTSESNDSGEGYIEKVPATVPELIAFALEHLPPSRSRNRLEIGEHYNRIAEHLDALCELANDDGTIGTAEQQSAYERVFQMSADEAASELRGATDERKANR